jgi:hypothetical protein
MQPEGLRNVVHLQRKGVTEQQGAQFLYRPLPDPHPWARPHLLKHVVYVNALVEMPRHAPMITRHSTMLVLLLACRWPTSTRVGRYLFGVKPASRQTCLVARLACGSVSSVIRRCPPLLAVIVIQLVTQWCWAASAGPRPRLLNAW